MRRFRSLLALLLIPFIHVPCAEAKWVDLGGPPLEVTLVEGSPERSIIRVDVGGFDAEPVMIDGKEYQQISLPGGTILDSKGLPALPAIGRSVIIPDDQEMQVRVLEEKHVDLPGYRIAPSKGIIPYGIDSDNVPYAFDPFYASTGAYPAVTAEQAEPYILRDFRGLHVSIRPFQHLPGSGTLRVYTSLALEVSAAGPSDVNVLHRSRPLAAVDREFDRIYQVNFMNYGLLRYSLAQEDGRLLILYPSQFESAVTRLAAWKTQRGLAVTPVDLDVIGEDPTAEQIKAYIAQEYGSETPISSVLLAGDFAEITSFMIPNDQGCPTPPEGPADPLYARLNGTDPYPEVFIGRMTGHLVEDIDTQVDRAIAYEKLDEAGDGWLTRATGIASDQDVDGQEDGNQHMDLIREDLLDYGYTSVDAYNYSDFPGPDFTAQDIADRMNEGRGYLNNYGHGGPSGWGFFQTGDIDLLENEDMLTIIHSTSCSVGAFDRENPDVCFAEAMVRAELPGGEAVGAVVMLAASLCSPAGYGAYVQDEAMRILVEDERRTVGGLWYGGVSGMVERTGSNNPVAVYEASICTIFGDPTLLYRSRDPIALTLTHEGHYLPGQAGYAAHIEGIPEACCAITSDGALLGVAYTDVNGDVLVPLTPPPAYPAVLTLTVTGHNAATEIVSIEPWPYVRPDGTGDYPTIQAAIDAAARGSYVILADGTYTGTGNRDIDFSGKEITVRSESNDPQLCWINCQGSALTPHRGFYFHTAEGSGSILSGIGVTGGYATQAYGHGGAVRCASASPTILDCRFKGNSSTRWGGAIYLNNADPTIVRCVITGNKTSVSIDDNGGGIFAEAGSQPIVSSCTIVDNQSTRGGGIGITGASSVQLSGSIVAFNRGKATDCLQLSLITASCTDVYGNTLGNWVSCLAGQLGINHNLQADPLFCDRAAGDYRFEETSPCHNADCGTMGALPVVPTCGSPRQDPLQPFASDPGTIALEVVGANPATGSLAYRLSLPTAGAVRVRVYDLDGRCVATLADRELPAGSHAFQWSPGDGSGTDLARGIYFLRIEAGGVEATRRFVWLP